MKEILTIIRNNRRLKILTISGCAILLFYVIGVAYGTFTNNQNKLAANIRVNDLSYYMTTNAGEENDRILKSKAGKTEVFNIYLTSLNNINTKYELIYKVCTDSSCASYKNMPNGFAVNISESSPDQITDEINANGNRAISIVTINTSSSDVYIEISLNAGYGWNELALSNQIYETSDFFQDDLRIISIVDGVEQKNAIFPDTGNYDVNLTCTKGGNAIPGFRGEGFWNDVDNKWELDLIGVLESGTTCNVEFIYQALTSIAVTTPPNKLTYAPGDTFDTTGMVVTAYTATGSYNATGYTVSPSVIVADTTSITISYSTSGITRSTTLAIEVINNISIVNCPSNNIVSEGDIIDTSDMIFKIYYANGNEQTVSSGFTVSPASSSGYEIVTYGNIEFRLINSECSIYIVPSFTYSGDYTIGFSSSGEWIIYLKSSGIIRFNDLETTTDIFMIGGGAGGGHSAQNASIGVYEGGSGGNGGNYVNKYNVSINNRLDYSITIGSGGNCDGSGGNTTGFTYTAAGATRNSFQNSGTNGTGIGSSVRSGKAGGNGVYAFEDSSIDGIMYGAGGGAGSGNSYVATAGGITGGGSGNGGSATANTGSGGGGGNGYNGGGQICNGGKGGSGIVIIRKHID